MYNEKFYEFAEKALSAAHTIAQLDNNFNTVCTYCTLYKKNVTCHDDCPVAKRYEELKKKFENQKFVCAWRNPKKYRG